MAGTITRGKVIRADLAQWDGVTDTYSRIDATGGTTSGLAIGNAVDVLQVFGSGSNKTRATIASAVAHISTARNRTLVFSPGTWTIDSSITIASNFTCVIPAGCVFSVDTGVTLTFSGEVYVEDPDSWYTGAGTVVVSLESVHGAVWHRTAAERTDTITPSSITFEPGDSRRNGTTGDNVADDTAELNNTLGGTYPTVRIPSGTYSTTGLTVSMVGGLISGDGINTRVTATGDHTLDFTASDNDGHVRDLWVDQLDGSGNYDALHFEAGEWHVSDIDIDFAPRYGIYCGAYRTQVEKIQSQAVLGTAIYVLNTAYRCQFNQLIFEDAGTDPGNGIDLNSEHCNVSDISSYQQAGWTVQSSGSYHTVQGVTAQSPGGATANNFVNISGTFNAFANLIGRGVTGIALNVTSGSNLIHGLITNNVSEESLVVSGNNNYVTGRLFNSGTGGTDNAVLLSGTSNRVDLDVSTHTGTYDLDATGSGNRVRGVYAGAVRLTGAQGGFDGACRNLVVQGDPTGTSAAFNVLNATITGGEAIGADIQGSSNTGSLTFVNAGAIGARVDGNNNVLQIRVFGATTSAVDVGGTGNTLSLNVSGTTAGNNDLLLDGSDNVITGYFAGNVTINGDRNVVHLFVAGNLTINAGADSNRVSGICVGTLTDNGASNVTSDLT